MKASALWLILVAAPLTPHRERQEAGTEEVEPQEEPEAQEPEQTPPVESMLGDLGIDLASEDGRYAFHLWFRGQFRYTQPFDGDPRTAEDFQEPDVTSIGVRRARIKAGGNAYRRWLRYYLEYDVLTPTLLDLHMTLAKYSWVQLRVGQWKVVYNRERVDSSGAQQFVDRSIVNDVFTFDRQPGVMLQGRLLAGRLFDSSYAAGVFNGNGINAANDDGAMMWVGRYQWNFFGRNLPFSQSDLDHRARPAGTVAIAAARNQSPYTRFSTGGAGQLDGFGPGEAGRYRLEQLLEEIAFKYRGFSFQHELHWKEVGDTIEDEVTDLRGGYAQAGYFPWGGSEHVLQPLELAARWAFVDPDVAAPEDERTELTFGANWFFAGHDNKLSFDVSRLTLDRPGLDPLSESRVRVQWDVSF